MTREFVRQFKSLLGGEWSREVTARCLREALLQGAGLSVTLGN